MPFEELFGEILVPITFKIVKVNEDKSLPGDPWKQSWFVYFDKCIRGEPLEYVIEASRKLVNQRFNVPLGQLEGMPTVLSENCIRVCVPK